MIDTNIYNRFFTETQLSDEDEGINLDNENHSYKTEYNSEYNANIQPGNEQPYDTDSNDQY